MSIFNLYITNQPNVGDNNCSPLLYFKFPFDIEIVNILDLMKRFDEDFYLNKYPDVAKAVSLGQFESGYSHYVHYGNKEHRGFRFFSEDSVLIVGGGGMLHHTELELLVKNSDGKLISWGIGHNTAGANKVVWPKYMNLFDLHGVRDYGSPWSWVPCASCMSPLFNDLYETKFDVVAYEHGDFPLNVNFPKMSNFHNSFSEVIKFLGSGEIVVTNTYHGAYWATLLNKKVFVLNPFNTKFLGFKHMPVVSNDLNDMKNTKSYPTALAECREANFKYYEKVCEYLT
jgi:hypothetical protein